MTKDEILDGNKLIAEFMEWVHSEDKTYDEYEMGRLDYHSSWESLMFVVEKIESIALFNVKINRFYTTISKFDPFDMRDISQAGITQRSEVDNPITKILAVWIAVIQFIKWHNENKK